MLKYINLTRYLRCAGLLTLQIGRDGGGCIFDFLIEKMLIVSNVVATIVDMHVWNSFINK